MANSKDSWETNIPTWNGSEETWNTYLEDVEWYFYSIEQRSRHLVASRLARKLQGPARNALKGLKAVDFAGVQGITKLLRILQSRIGDLPVPDLAHKLDEFIFKLRRRPGESMNEWGLRSIETYRKLTTALDRVKGKASDIGTFEEPPPPRTQNPGNGKFPWPHEWEEGWNEDDWEKAEFGNEDDYDRDSEHSQQAERTWRGKMGERTRPERSRSSSASSYNSSKSRKSGNLQGKPTKPDDDEPFKDEDGFLPTEVRGWLLLRNAGLTYTERATVIASTQGNLAFAVIFRALRQQYPPRDLGKIDEQRGKRNKGKGKGGLNLINDDDDEYSEEQGKFLEDEDGEADAVSLVNTDRTGDPEFEALQVDEMEAMAAVGVANRTLVQARKAIQQAKLARGFHPRKPLPQGFRGGFRAKSGGTGQGHGSVQVQNRGKDGPCFICGGPHGYKDCPDRNAPKPRIGSAKAVLGTVFTVGLDAMDSSSTGTSTDESPPEKGKGLPSNTTESKTRSDIEPASQGQAETLTPKVEESKETSCERRDEQRSTISPKQEPDSSERPEEEGELFKAPSQSEGKEQYKKPDAKSRPATRPASIKQGMDPDKEAPRPNKQTENRS